MGKPRAVVAGVFLLWIALATPRLLDQLERTETTWNRFGGLDLNQRAATFNKTSVGVTQDLSSTVPESECVLVLAYAGPSLADFYRRRFAYNLYPRRVHLATNWQAQREGCAYLAVFRDDRANLDSDPFQGRWNEEELNRRLSSLERVTSGEVADVYRVP